MNNTNNNIRTLVEQDTRITAFQRKVYLALLDIPRGSTISYKELGERIGCRSAQAIGQALKRNPFAPDVPCHRVIRSDGSIGGFMGQRDGEQIEKKRRLLEEERLRSHPLHPVVCAGRFALRVETQFHEGTTEVDEAVHLLAIEGVMM